MDRYRQILEIALRYVYVYVYVGIGIDLLFRLFGRCMCLYRQNPDTYTVQHQYNETQFNDLLDSTNF